MRARPNIRRLAAFAAVFALGVGGVTFSRAGIAHAGGAGYVSVDPPRSLGEIALVRGGGGALDRDALAGRWTLLSIGFTNCPDVCPMVLANLAAVAAEIQSRSGPEAVPRVVFVSVDPARDTPDYLFEYVRHFDERFVGATGEKAAIDTLIKSLGGFYRLGRKDKDGFYTVRHTAEIYLLDPDVRLHGRFQPPLNPKDAAKRYLAVVAAAGKQSRLDGKAAR